jgi:gliding motility-associated-like protein
VTMQLLLSTFFAPNSSSPLWEIGETQYIRSIQFLLTDVYGRVVFCSANPRFQWDGKVNGIPAPSGLYCWSSIVTFQNQDKPNTFSGKVILIK